MAMTAWAAPARSSELGIDRSWLSSQSAAVQEKTLKDIQGLGATWFRDGPTSGSARGVANFVNEVRLAKQDHLKVLMTIAQMDEDYDVPLQTHDHGWKAKKLSQINLQKFTQRFENLLGALKAAGLTIDAVEFGSEDDSYYYDADVPYDHLATAGELHTWLRGYGAFLKTGATILHDPRYFPGAKIITFGMAHGCDQCAGPPRHLADPARAVAMLKNVDGFNYLSNASYHVDGYGTHIYVSPNYIDGVATQVLRADAAALGGDKPLWITEWGFLDLNAFPNKKGETLSRCIQTFLDTFDRLRTQISIGPMMFYRHDIWLSDASGKLLPQSKVLAAYAAKQSP
ncbi:hypothetical protein [Rhizobium sp. NPDC090279]|uniref:hypothetical protein n=1 Tax=Rhizobium sp. NPDC090279 TaxID=3364499 RepID=UPI003839E495